MLRAEAFIAAVRPTRMRQVSADQVTAFLMRHPREHRLTGWQFRPLVDALQWLLVDLSGNEAAARLDWGYWRSAGETLTADHPTVAAALPAEEAVEQTSRFASTARYRPVRATEPTHPGNPGHPGLTAGRCLRETLTR